MVNSFANHSVAELRMESCDLFAPYTYKVYPLFLLQVLESDWKTTSQ